MRSLAGQLRDAWVKSDQTLDELIVRASLDLTPPSLSRKLRGEQVMSTEECQALAEALNVTLVWMPDEVQSS